MQIHDQIPTRHVIIGVDVQNDFIDGSLAVKGGKEVIPPLNELTDHLRSQLNKCGTNENRRALGSIAFTRDWHPAQTPHFEAWPVHCVANTRGAEFHPNLHVESGDTIINKGTGTTDGYSGTEGASYTGETLESIVEPKGWEKVHVYIGGLATDYCVKATAIDLATIFAQRATVSVFGIEDAMRGVNLNPEDSKQAICDMETAGVKMVTAKQAIAMITEERIK